MTVYLDPKSPSTVFLTTTNPFVRVPCELDGGRLYVHLKVQEGHKVNHKDIKNFRGELDGITHRWFLVAQTFPSGPSLDHATSLYCILPVDGYEIEKRLVQLLGFKHNGIEADVNGDLCLTYKRKWMENVNGKFKD